jgi:pimeloyl-ACP methyl ester carboxylesterase
MSLHTARHGPVELAYERIGPEGEPLLLVMGTGGQMLSWPDGFCRLLTERGFQVIRFDNRDAGLSTHMTDAGRPSQLTMVLRPAAAAVYTLADMAGDAVAVMDDAGWESAHVVGISQGGMIAQVVATDRPARVRSLTSISSAPGPKIGSPGVRALARIVRAANPRGVRTAEDLADYLIGLDRVIGSPGYPVEEDDLRALAARLFERAGDLDLASAQRQTAALVAAGDRRAALAGVRVPTLVIHGEDDPFILPAGGRATAAAIPGARLVTHPGMGHNLPPGLWSEIVAEISELAVGAGARLSAPQ